MQYKFSVTVPMDDIGEVIQSDGALIANGNLSIVATVSLNTELPDDKVEELRQSVSKHLSQKIGFGVEAQLTSQEH
jgi:hypothetical protein